MKRIRERSQSRGRNLSTVHFLALVEHLWRHTTNKPTHSKRVYGLIPLNPHSQKLTVTSYSIFVGLAVVVVFCAISWFAAPKGNTQTYVFLPYVPSGTTAVH
jgi:hypothetical protein